MKKAPDPFRDRTPPSFLDRREAGRPAGQAVVAAVAVAGSTIG